MIDQSPSQLRGNAPAFQPTASHINTSPTNPSSLRGNAPAFHTKAINWQQKRRHPTSIIPSQPQSGFLSRLPGEIRNQIYELVLTQSIPIPAVRAARMPRQHEYEYMYKYKFNTPALGQVCRQILQECLAIAYSDNTFIFKLLPGEACIPKTLINGWVKRLARAGVDKCVKRVGCEWTSKVWRKGVVTVHWSVTATLGEDDSPKDKLAKQQWELQLNMKQRRKLKHQRQRGPYAVLLDGDSAPGTARPKVVFEVDPPIEGLCEHVLDAYARAFKGRREGKSVRGYGALIDVVLTVCNFLRPEESEVWPIKVCRVCDGFVG
jgi:hypothetical protein